MAKKTCNFCGRPENEVKLLITGLHGYICEECAEQAYPIVRSSGLLDSQESGKHGEFKLKKVPKPHEIKDYLDATSP